jgi:hypothetical protein
VVQDVLGTLNPAEIRARVHALEPKTDEIFFAASVGARFGVIRRDSSRVAIKVHKRYEDDGYFTAMQQVQSGLRRTDHAQSPLRLPIDVAKESLKLVYQEVIARGC